MGNFIIGIFENIANRYVDMVNLIIKGLNLLPGVNIGPIGEINLPRFNVGGAGGATATPGGTSGPDLIERRFAAPVVPVVPAPAVELPAPSGGGGGGGGAVGGGGGGLGRGMVGILPVEEGFFGGGGGGIGGSLGEQTLLSDTGGITVIVNAAIAEASLGDAIVDALTDYNRRSGPLQLQIA
jgi:hypothetical protein